MITRVLLLLLVLLLELLPARGVAASPFVCSAGFGIYSSGIPGVGKRCVTPIALDGFRIYSSGSVKAVAVQPWDAKILIGGDFTATNRAGESRKNLARINPDGTLDTTFSPTLDGPVNAIAVWPDPNDPASGLIFAGGDFGNLNNSGNLNPRGLAQIKSSDGSLVKGLVTTTENVTVKAIALQAEQPPGSLGIFVAGTFPGVLANDSSPNFAKISLADPAARPPGWLYPEKGADQITDGVDAILLQQVGQNWMILVGGGFSAPQHSLARFSAQTGSFDATLPPLPPGSAVRSLALQADGKLLIGGDFSGQPLVRLDSGGVPEADFNPGFTPGGYVASIVVQPDGKILVAGSFQIGSLKSLARLKIGPAPEYHAVLDDLFTPAALDANKVVNALALQKDEKILAGGDFTKVGTRGRVMLARFYPRQGALDDDIPGNLFAIALSVLAVSLHPDGTTSIAGQFTSVQTKLKNRFARLGEDWNLVDANFNPAIDSTVNVLAPLPLPDKSLGLVAGGLFTTVGGVAHNRVVLLDASGKPGASTTAFNNSMNSIMPLPPAGGSAQVMAVLEGGLIYMGGNFKGNINGISRPPYDYLARFHQDGTRDTDFQPTSPPALINAQVSSIAVQQDGKVLVGTNSGKVTRLDSFGTPDLSFDPTDLNLKINGKAVFSIVLQNDGRVVSGAYLGHFFVAGAFISSYTDANGTWQRQILRVKEDGTIDPEFKVETTDSRPGVVASSLYGISPQTDGSLLIYGVFNKVKDAKGAILYCQDVARLKYVPPSGQNPESWELDPEFNLGTFGSGNHLNEVATVNLHPDGKVVVGGQFSTLNGKALRNLVRLSNGRDGWASQDLSVTPSPDGATQTVTWLRKGAGPELWRVWFEDSPDPDFTTTVILGNGKRIAGGWQLDNQNLAQYESGTNRNHYLRARGYVAGDRGGAGSLIQSVRFYYRNDTVTAIPQVIIFGTPPDLSYGAVGAVSATGGASGEPVTFESRTLDVCTTSSDGTTVRALLAGSCTIAANQAGNASYLAAAEATQTFSIRKATPAISWANLDDITYGMALSGTQLNAHTGGVGGILVYSPVSGTVLSAGSAQPLSVTFTPTDSGNYTPAAMTQRINVVKAPLTVGADNKTRAFNTANPPLTASYQGFVLGQGAAAISGSPDLSTPATQASPVGSYDILASLGSLTAPNYRFILANGTLSVIKSCQEIVFPPISDRRYGDPPFVIQASACSGLGVTLASSDPQVATLNGNLLTITGAGSVVITAAREGDDNLDGSRVSQTLVVHRSGQAVVFPPLPRHVMGDPPFTLNATATSGLPVSYQSSDPDVAEINGSTVTLKGAGTTVITASQSGSGNFNEALASSQPLIVASEGEPPLLVLSTLATGSVTANPVLNIAGAASDPSGISSLTVNGADLTDRAALFSSAVSLGVGENNIEVIARDGEGNRTTVTRSIKLDAAAPEISLSEPADNSVSSDSLFTARGIVTPGSDLSLGVNGAALQSLTVSDGAFTGSGYLEPGVNTIELTAALLGRVSKVKRSVTLSPGQPSVAITEPFEDLRTEKESITIRGTVGGEGSVLLDVSGKSFSPAVSAGAFQQLITLDHSGEFRIQASFTDSGGNSSVAQRNIIRVDRILGDMDGDGCVDIGDAAAVLRISLGMEQASAGALAHGDVAPLVDGVPQPDGKIDVGDLLVILRKIVGLVDF